MRRSAGKRLEGWIRRRPRKPLVIRGARQVGKSTLVTQFAEDRALTLHEVNLEKHVGLASIFETFDTARILRELEFVCGRGRIGGEGHLLFLDEIQAVPVAIQALRYLYEDRPDLPVIAAGSLLEFALSKHSFSIAGYLSKTCNGEPSSTKARSRNSSSRSICHCSAYRR